MCSRPIFPSRLDGPLRQGEILSQVLELRALVDVEGNQDEAPAVIKEHPTALVLTQDCDLDWDFKTRKEGSEEHPKLLPNILLCELWPAKRLRGHHRMNSDIWRRVKKNQDERYHFLDRPLPEQDAAGEGFEDDLAIDFKRVFAISTGTLYACLGNGTARRCWLMGPYMQNVSNRFGYYQLRIALPEVEPASASDAF